MRADNLLLGIGALIASTVCYSASDVASKFLTVTLPPVEVAWMRYIVFALVMLPLLLTSGRSLLRTQSIGPQVLRGVTTAFSTMLFVVAIMYMPIAEVTSIGFICPILVTGLAILFLGETVGIRRWIASAVGLAGVVIIVQPGGAAFQPASLLPLACALSSAASAICLRRMKGERSETTMAYSAFIGAAVLTVMVAFRWQMPDGQEIAVGLLSGVLITVANLLQIVAYRSAPASTLAPFSYLQLIWASAMGLAVFGVFPSSAVFVGGAIIAASGIYTAYRERVQALRRSRAALAG